MVDHDRLVRIWKLEIESRKLRAILADHESRIAKRAAEIHQCKIRISQGNAKIEQLNRSLKQWEKDIEKLQKRIELVNQTVQMGHLQDPFAAEQQISQLQGQIDALENQYLEALEEQDRLDLREGIEQDSIRNHQEQSLKITDKLENLRPTTLNRLDAIATQTESLLTQMNPSVANRYRLMNEKLERAVVAVRKDACGGCYNKLPTELLWTALHRSTICFCPYCSVFLIPSEVD